ncbi:MAG TPA: acyl carrier protein [Candidatus Tectomicrobia bacterium]
MTEHDGKNSTGQEIGQAIKKFILDEFLPGEDPSALTDSTPLLTGGILDSLATVSLVLFLEERYQIKIEAHDTTVDYFNTISDIEQLIRSKL